MTKHSTWPAVRLARIAAIVLATAVAGAPAWPAQEVHGTSDAFTGHGVAIAWAVLRGASEDSTAVVLRVAVEPGRFAQVGADGVDPFTTERRSLARPAPPEGGISELNAARKHFADFPRTELLLFEAKAPPSTTPDLVIYYLGVPDTTPEFPTRSALDAYLTERIAKLRGSAPPGSK
jgi:hypothetical protein